jgi:RHS repeat-associated protein
LTATQVERSAGRPATTVPPHHQEEIVRDTNTVAHGYTLADIDRLARQACAADRSLAADMTTRYEYTEDSNRLLAAGERDYQYDAAGNTLDDGRHTYTYDARNRLVAVDEGVTASYRHNALGERVHKKAGGIAGDLTGDGTVGIDDLHSAIEHAGELDCDGPSQGRGRGRGQQVACVATRIGDFRVPEHANRPSAAERKDFTERYFVYDEGGRLIGEYDAQGGAVTEIVYLGDIPVSALRDGQGYNIHTDHLNTPRAISDAAGVVLWWWESDPFGVAVPDDDANHDGHAFAFNLRFPGQYFDEETGLHYNYFREYKPEIGRYIQTDPIGLLGGVNTYSYVTNSPVHVVDPSGLRGGPPGIRTGLEGVPVNVSVGAGGSIQAGPIGVRATTSIAVDSRGRICLVSQLCSSTTTAFGMFGMLGISGSVGLVGLCEGETGSIGLFSEGGSGITASGSIDVGPDGATVAKGMVGMGGGIAGGFLGCHVSTICFN